MEEMQTEVMYFVHHFPTHSTVTEVSETTYKSLAEVRPSLQAHMFETLDGKVYRAQWPMMMGRETAENYVTVESNEYLRYTVIEISNDQPETPITFECVSYYRGTQNVEEYGTLDALTLHLMQDAEPEYRNPVLAWAKDTIRGIDFRIMNGSVIEIWSAK